MINRRYAGLCIALLALCSVWSWIKYWPSHPERYIKPTALSYVVQKYIPQFYWPHIQVFAGRFGSDAMAIGAVAVLGPDCHRLAISDVSQLTPATIRTDYCSKPIDVNALIEAIRATVTDGRTDWRYKRI